MLDDITAWIIIIGFYAPLHFMLPVLFLFITGTESEALRRTLMHSRSSSGADQFTGIISTRFYRIALLRWSAIC